MAKKQSRRSISVRGTTYQRLREHCAGAAISMSDFVEQRIADFFHDPVDAAPPRTRPLSATTLAAKAKAALANFAKPDKVEKKPMRLPLPPARPVTPPASAKTMTAMPLRKAPMPPARVPLASAIVSKKGAPTAALRSTGNGEISGPRLPGRPAPTPASKVIKARVAAKDKNDYRSIRF